MNDFDDIGFAHSPDIEVRRKCLKIALEMVTSRNVNDVVGFLKKELVKTHEQEYEKVRKQDEGWKRAVHNGDGITICFAYRPTNIDSC